MTPTLVQVPELVRIKPGALARLGLYLSRARLARVWVLESAGLLATIAGALEASLAAHGVALAARVAVHEASVEQAVRLLGELPRGCDAVVGVGGGKALDTAKYVAALAGLPYYAAPTSLSNDGFCSPQASLTLGARRRSLPARLPRGVVVDTAVCRAAPRALWAAGVGDLVAKLTATHDWKLAFHARGTPVNDLAALLSDASVYQFLARPSPDDEGVRALATALMLNGVAMEIAGSSRPASGSEHLVSHALDGLAAAPRLHGLQVGVAAYLMAHAQGRAEVGAQIAALFAQTGVWDEVRAAPFVRAEWLEAVRRAPSVKDDFYTVLSARDCVPEVARRIDTDPHLAGCFTRP